MTLSRRSFLKGLVAAPAIVTAANIMPIWVPKQDIIKPATLNTHGMIVFLNGVLQEHSNEWIIQPGYHIQIVDPITKQSTFHRL